MLLTQKAVAEGGRAMIYHAAKLADKMADALASGDQAAYEAADDKLGFYTPILKGFLTELGLEAANHGIKYMAVMVSSKNGAWNKSHVMHVSQHCMKVQRVSKHLTY